MAFIVQKNERVLNMDNKSIKVTMTIDVLEDIIYHTAYRASRRANTELFKGILQFQNKMSDDLELLIREQEYIKLLLQDRNMNNYEEQE